MFPSAPMEEVFTTRPHPRSRMPGRTAWAQRKDPLRLTPRTWSHCSSVILAASPLDLLGDLLGAGRVGVVDGDPRPLGGETPGRGLADAARRPRDQRHLVLEPHHVLRSIRTDCSNWSTASPRWFLTTVSKITTPRSGLEVSRVSFTVSSGWMVSPKG